MKRWIPTALTAIACAAPGHASDQPASAPIPAWVRQHEVPPAVARPGAVGSRALLRDDQVLYAPDGAKTTFWENALQVLSPEGMSGAANVALSWDPELDTLTIHRLRLIRDGKPIDVLATQHFTVLHRETNLERASLDGRLTASLQIAGLRVGDVVDFAASRTHRDPALDGHQEDVFGFRPDSAVQRLDAHWQSREAMQWRAFPGLPDPAVTHAGPATALSLAAIDLPDPQLPKGAPARFRVADAVQLTDWRDWAQVSARMAALFGKAAEAKPGGQVAQEAARIAAATTDPVGRTEAALATVQNQVRYLFLGLADGGYVPAAADLTWERRFGDCKGKTALLLALLHALDVEAQPVLVNTGAVADALPRYLPAAGLFDHVVVRATIAGRTYWLDGTRLGDRRLADIETPAFHWGLPVQAAGAALVPIMPASAARPLRVTQLRIDASGGVGTPAPMHGDYVLRGDAAQQFRRTLAALTPEARDRFLRDFWRKGFDYLEPGKVSATFDAAAGEATTSVDGTATLDWGADGLELEQMQVKWQGDFTRDGIAGADVPFSVPFPYRSVVRESIVLPAAGSGYRLDAMALDRTIAGVRWRRSGAIENGVAQLRLEADAVQPEFAAAEAPGAATALRLLRREHLYLRKPG